MLHWFLRQAGAGHTFLEHPGDLSLHVQSPLALGVGLPLVALAGVGIYRRQRRNLASSPRRLVVALTACRVAVLGLLVAVLAGPFVRLDAVQDHRPVFALLFDRSRSMDLPAGDAHPGRSRAELAHAAFTTGRSDLVVPAAERFDVKAFTFARDVTPVGIDAVPDPGPPGGPSSRIGDAVAHVLKEAAGRPVAGIVVFTDGESTGGLSLAEVALACKAARVPVFGVPTGPVGRARDVSVVDISTSGQCAVGDTARVGVALESHGFDGTLAKVTVRDGNKVLDTKELALRSTEQQHVELSFAAGDPGPRYLVAEVAPLPDEAFPTNNTDVALLRVTDEKLKVLYVDGLPRWDFRFLKNAMRRDTGLTGRDGKFVDIVLEAEWRRLPTETQGRALPRALDELAAYHTVVLGDASPRLLTPGFLALLGQAVREKGVGLVAQVGPQAMPHAFDRTLRDLLPVQMEDAPGVYAAPAKPFRLELAPDGALHEAMQFYDDPARNQAAWAELLPFQWCAAAVRPTPAATVLAVNPTVTNSFGELPLIAWHQAGRGRVLFVGTDSTWLWRQNAGDRLFYKFWGQAIRFVGRPDDAGKKSWLEVKPVRATPGDDVTIELKAYAADGSPMQQPTATIAVSRAGAAATVSLAADPDQPGRYAGRFRVQAAGDYRFAYGLVETRFHVPADLKEMRSPNVNRPALKQLADATGGDLVELSDPRWAKHIVAQLKGEAKQVRRPPEDQSLWDNWLVLGVLVAVYSLDVALRRFGGLA
jgi:hypothetical protein